MKRLNEDYLMASEFQVLKLLADDPDLELKDISGDSFPHKKARVFYKAIRMLHDLKETVNEGSLFREANRMDDSIDIATTRTLITYVVDLSNLNKALEDLKEGSIKYKMGRYMEKMGKYIQSPDSLDHPRISSLLYEAQDVLVSGKRKTLSKTFEELMSNHEQELERRKVGLYYPFYDSFLDAKLTKKAAPGQVILVAGSTGTGKSIYGLSLINGLVNNNVPCIYFSPEMDEVSTMDRWLAMRTGIPVAEWYKSGIWIDPLFLEVERERKKVVNKPFRFVDEPTIGLDTILHLVREFKMIYRTNYVCVFIDLITQVKEFITLGIRNASLATVIEMAVNKLHAMSKRENVCFVCFAQMNRDADSLRLNGIEEIDKLRPSLNHVKNSNALGERSRTVLSVFRPKYYAQRLFPTDPNVEFMPDDLQVQILKQSMGEVGVIGHYLFDGPTFSLVEMRNDQGESTTENSENSS